MADSDAADWLSAGAALQAIMAGVQPLSSERVTLAAALGSILAEDITATVSLPPWDNSAMDGFAVRGADLADIREGVPARLRVVDDIPAGGFPAGALHPGEAARIMTGAPVPAGCDSVVRVEHTDGGHAIGLPDAGVEIRSAEDAGRNIRPAGGDIRAGDVPLRRGNRMTPARIGVAAALGCATVPVVRRPRVAVLASGDELVDVDRFDEVRAGRRIVSSNSYVLAAQLASIGCDAVMLGIAGDTPTSLREHLDGARGCDALITTAGVSVGEHDHVRRVLGELGMRPSFWRVRARPGSALAFGQVQGLGDIPWFGLPGNPVSTTACFELFVRPALLRMAGHELVHLPPVPARLAEGYPATGAFTHFARVTISSDADGHIARLTRSQGTGLVTAMADADALLVLPPGDSLPAGAPVKAILLDNSPLSTEPAF